MNNVIETEEGKSLNEYLSAIKRRKYYLLIPALVIFLLTSIVAYVWPPTFRSTATILIEEQEIPKDLIRSTITSFASQQIQVIKQRTMTLQNIMVLIDKYQLYEPSEMRRKSKTDLAKDFQDNVELDVISAEVVDPRSGRPTEATIAFSLSYSHGIPIKAQKVTSELVTLYLNENLRSRTEKSESTSEFLRSEADSLANKVSILQSKLAEFKAEHEGSLPELYQYNMNMVDRLEQEISNNQLRMNDLVKRRIKLKSDLAQVSPYGPSYLETGQRVLNDRGRLKALQSEYRAKLSVYNEQHPDIARLKREIDLLKISVGDIPKEDKLKLIRAERDKLSAMRKKYSSTHPEIKAQKRVVEMLEDEYELSMTQAVKEGVSDNPNYIILDTQLQSVESEINLLNERNRELSEKVTEYEKLISVSPAVEKDYSAILREIQSTQLKEQEIKAKLMEAELSTNLEQGRKGERFILIQPPLLPEKPVSPNRLAIVVMGFILAIFAGLIFVFIAEAIDPSIRGAKALYSVTGVAPLVTVPYMKSEESLRSIRRAKIAAIILLVLGIIFAIAAVHFFVKPLDVIWFYFLRSFGYGV